MSGERAVSRISLEAEVIHDGDPDVLAQHVAVELRGHLERWGVEVLHVDIPSPRMILPGDAVSRLLPTIAGRQDEEGPQ